MPPNPEALVALMDDMRQCFAGNPPRFGDDLAGLFDNLRGLSFGPDAPAHRRIDFAKAEVAGLGDLLERLRTPFEFLEVSGLFASPWEAASLRRDEVRNASVLRWFLDPNGGHGCGEHLLAYVLGRVASDVDSRFPAKPSLACTVVVEECPDGDQASRVDIQIDDPSFFLIIEVKIDAIEQQRQLERYGDIAAARTGSTRPWAVVFLTPDRRASRTAGNHAAKVVSVSWRELAAVLRRAARNIRPVPEFLATSFAVHMANL